MKDETVTLTDAGLDRVDQIIERNLSVPCPVCYAVADAFCDGRVKGDWFGSSPGPGGTRNYPFPVHRERFKLGRKRVGLE